MDGVIGHDTWNAIVSDYNATIGGSADTYPGIPCARATAARMCATCRAV